MKAIAIDGPAGSGKSTIAKALALRLGYLYIDTGAMYRATALKMMEEDLFFLSDDQLEDRLEEMDLRLSGPADGLSVLLEEKDVSQRIRKKDVTAQVARVASLASVRRIMTEKQRQMAKDNNVVMDGRDIGSTVLPQADYKFYLSASLEERARRRMSDFKALGDKSKLADIMDDIRRRDQADKGRAISPLSQAEDAVYIDTTQMTIQEVLSKIEEMIED